MPPFKTQGAARPWEGEPDARRFLSLMFQPGDVCELRAPKTGFRNKETRGGYFNDVGKLIEAARQLEHDGARGIYVVMNPLNPDLLARACNRLATLDTATADEHVTARRWLLLDIDPKRPAGISSNDAEHEAAISRVRALAGFLSEAGWPAPAIGDSGNGAHAYYRIDLPADDGGLIARFLKALAAQFDDDIATMDTGVGNASRITKFFGTLSRKGDPIPGRPHRRSKLIDVPEELRVVPVELIEAIAATAPSPPAHAPALPRHAPAPAAPAAHAGRPSSVERAAAYLAKVDPAIEGSNGRKATFAAAAVAAWDFGLDESAALDALRGWNARCSPPWSEDDRDYLGMIRDAAGGANAKQARGWRLEQESARKAPTKPRAARTSAPSPKPSAAPKPSPAVPAVPAVPVPSSPSVRETDLGNARRLISGHGDDLRYCAALSSWLIWDGTRWQRDEDEEINRRAKATIEAIYREAASSGDPDDRTRLHKHAVRSEARARIEAMVAVAQSEKIVAIVLDSLDQTPLRFTAANGTIDLATGELRPHARADLATKISPIAYDPSATCPSWDRFLLEIMGGGTSGAELAAYLQRAIGYSLTGDVREHAIFFLYGNGSNGKSTFLEIVRALVGDYARNAEFETFLASTRSPGSAREDLARLRGARLVTAAEAPEGRRFDESLLKSIAGGDMVTAREFYCGSFEFRPQLKLWLSGNHKPVIKGTDDGIWRRFHLVPFAVKYHDNTPENAHLPERLRKDLTLPARLQAELPGILAWAVRGCLEWKRIGLAPPLAVRSATIEYRTQMDTIGDFIRDKAFVSPNARVSSADLYASYTGWCRESGEKPATNTFFGLRMAERAGISKGRDRFGKIVWNGIAVRSGDSNESNGEKTEGSEGFDPLSYTSAIEKKSYEKVIGNGQNPSDPSVSHPDYAIPQTREPGDDTGEDTEEFEGEVES